MSIANNTVLYNLEVVKRVNLRCSYHKEKIYVTWWMLMKHCGNCFATYAYIESLCCIVVLNHYFVYVPML